MPAGPAGSPGQGASRWVAPAVLCAGGLCALAGAAWLYVGPELGMLLRPETEPSAEVDVKKLVPAAFAVVGTILVSVGLVFVLERAGVLAAAGRRQGVEERSGTASPNGGDPERSTGAAEPVGSGSSRAEPDDRSDLLTNGAPDRGASDAAPVRSSDEAFSARVATPEAPDAPESAFPVPETAEPAPGGEEPPPADEPQPGDLIEAWDNYRRDGDGHFNPRGLQRVLDHRRLAASVSGGEGVGAGGAVLIVETPSGAPGFYVLPSFNKSPRAVVDWFEDNGDGALTGRTRRVNRIARGRWVEAGAGAGGRNFEVTGRGEVA